MSGGSLTTPPSVRPEHTDAESVERGTDWSGWLAFAGAMIFIAGAINAVYGIAAIDDSSFFVHNTKYIFSDLNTWGWIVLLIGVVQVLAGIGIWLRSQVARWVGIVGAGVSAVAQLLWLPSYPLAALAIFALDVIILYALLSHGGRKTA